jgi:hypothetical protein
VKFFPGIGVAPAAGQRRRAPRTTFPRPGIPSLEEARVAAANAGGDRLLGGAAFFATVMHPFKRDAPTGDSSWADKLFVDLLSVLAETESPVMGFVLWAASRMTTASGVSVARYCRAIDTRCLLELGWSPGKNPAVNLFLRRAMMMEGALRATARPALAIPEYLSIIADTALPAALRSVATIAWRRMARVGDILELRVGDLYQDGGEFWLLQTFHKSEALGAYDRLALVFSSDELTLLEGRIANGPPTTPSMQRPLMFPGITTANVADMVERHMGARLGAHAFRRGAMRAAVDSGVPLVQAMLLSLHRDSSTALGYVLYPDAAATAAMRAASSGTTAAPAAGAPARPRGLY